MELNHKKMIEAVEDETDEFEVISREDESDNSKVYGVAYNQSHDDASTVCDDEDGLDRAENSAVPSRCESLVHSMCLLSPFNTESPVQYEKFINAVKEENEKNRLVLEQIASMVGQLTKEKTDNMELRAKMLTYEMRIKQLEDSLMKYKNKEDIGSLNENILVAKLNEAIAQNVRKDAHIAELNTIITEKNLRIISLEQDNQTSASGALDNEVLEKLKRENASQTEIIRMLTDEIAEGDQELRKARKDYHDKLGEISEQWERDYRAEVNH